MQVTVESGEGLERRMTVGLPPEEIEAKVEERLRELTRNARLPGFRPGKVPFKVMRQRFGKQVQQEAFGELVQSTFAQAMSQEKLNPAGMPQIEQDIDPAEKRYAYTATFEVLPEIELGSLEGKILKRPVAEATDGDVDELVARLREQRKVWNPVDRAAQDGDQVTVSFVGSIEGEKFEGGSAEDVKMEIGNGQMIEGLESGLIGMGAGEERTLDLKFPDDYRAEHLRGKDVAFAVTLKGVAESQLPEVDEEFVKAFGVQDGDVERFRRDVRGNMERELKQRIEARVKSQAMDMLIEANPLDLPRVLIQEETKALKEQARQNAGGTNIELPDNLFEEPARRRVALGLIVAEVVKANSIELDPERVRQAVADMASTYEQPQEMIDYYYSKKEHLAPIENLTLENQVVDWIVDQVQVEDEPMTFKALTDPSQPA